MNGQPVRNTTTWRVGNWVPAVTLALLTSCGGTTSPPVATPVTEPDNDVPYDLRSVIQPTPKHVVFDLPALRHKTIDQIRAELGPPDWDDGNPVQQGMSPLPVEWDKTYSKDSIMLNIRYYYRTGKVKYFHLETQYGCVDATPAGFKALLATGNLTPTSREFRIYPVYYEHNKLSHRYSMAFLSPRK